jgi:sodium transport system ATP-binding protein
VIEICALHKGFVQGRGRTARRVQAVDGLSWVAHDGQISALLGPNGAGKTTLLRIVSGLLRPDAGQVRVDGIDVAAQPRAALARMGVLGDARGLYPRLSARENIVYYARLHGMSDAAPTRAPAWRARCDMEALLDRRTEGFSQGERMKTALARALVHDPHNIVLDEPTNGLDVLATRALREALRRLRDEQGKCIVFSTHIMQEVERLCDQVVVMAQGRTVAQGTVPSCARAAGESDFERGLRAAGLRRRSAGALATDDRGGLDRVPQGAARRAARPAHAAARCCSARWRSGRWCWCCCRRWWPASSSAPRRASW